MIFSGAPSFKMIGAAEIGLAIPTSALPERTSASVAAGPATRFTDEKPASV